MRQRGTWGKGILPHFIAILAEVGLGVLSVSRKVVEGGHAGNP